MFHDEDVDQDGSLLQSARGMMPPTGQSPKRKKRPQHTFKMFGKGTSNATSTQENTENCAPSIFQMSQLELSQGYSQGFSQSSQASFIGNYFGQMTVHDGAMDEQSFSGDAFQLAGVAHVQGGAALVSTGSGPLGGGKPFSSSADHSAGQLRTTSPTTVAAISGSGSASASAALPGSTSQERERQITLPAVQANPFLGDAALPIHNHNHPSASKPPQHLWVSAFRPWPRFYWDFEAQCVLGEGVQSVVYCARRRLDGFLYAIKKLKRQIMSEKEGLLLTREACALAAFAGCPNLLRYYSSWIDDGFLHIQTELCQLGSLEALVGANCHWLGLGMELGMGPGSVGGRGQELQRTRKDNFSESQSQSQSQSQQQQQQHAISALTDKHISLSQLPLSQIDPNPLSQLSQIQQLPGASQTVDVCIDGSGVPESISWLVMAKVAHALAFLHARGVAHLDVRPANIFIAVSDSSSSGSSSGSSSSSEGALNSYKSASAQEVPSASATQTANNDRDRDREAVQAAIHSLVCSAPFPFHSSSPDPELLVRALLTPSADSDLRQDRSLNNGLASLRLGDLGQCCSINSGDFAEGESRYCAREVINCDLKTIDLCKADIFSLGASCYELCLGRPLGAGGEGAHEWHSLRDGVLSEGVIQRYSPELIEAFRFLMHPAPSERPTALQVVRAAETRLRVNFGPADTSTSTSSEEVFTEIQRLRAENTALRALIEEGRR